MDDRWGHLVWYLSTVGLSVLGISDGRAGSALLLLAVTAAMAIWTGLHRRSRQRRRADDA